MVTVTAALILPYVLELSTQTLVCLILFCIGLFVTLQDALTLAEASVRRRASTFLNTVVLDDVLKSWFDPETGWVACWTCFFVGNATMYSLPMTDNQRVRLVQSCLWTSDEQAKSILTSPGGFQVMLPEKLQLWLNGDSAENTRALEKNEEENECDRSNLTEETEPSEAETKESDKERRVPSKVNVKQDAPSGRSRATEKKDTAAPPPLVEQNSPQTHPQYPLDAMGSILKEMAMDFIKRTCTRIPGSTVQGLAVAASTAFALQMYKSPRSRRIVTGAVEGTTALTFVSVAIGAIVALITKARVLEGNQQASLIRIILAKLKQAGGLRRVQGMIAVLVLWHFGRRPRGRLQPPMHLAR